MSTLFRFNQSFQYFMCLQTQKSCNFDCPAALERKLPKMALKPGTAKQTTSHLTAREPLKALIVVLQNFDKIFPSPLTITDHQPQMLRPQHILNGLEWHATAFLEPFGPLLGSFYF